MNTFQSAKSLFVILAAPVLNEMAPVTTNGAPANPVFAVQNRVSSPNFQLFLNLRADGSAAYSGPLYSPAGGVYAADFRGDTLYAVELPNGTTANYLVSIPYEGAFIGQGKHVSTNPIGFSDVEGLAVVDGVLFATSLSYEGHHSRLITIDPESGIGTLVGTTGTDIMIAGLAYDPAERALFGAGFPFATQSAKLYRIDPGNAHATEIGPLTVPIQSLTWHATLGLMGAFAKLYQIDPKTGAAAQIGTNDFTDGRAGTFNGIYALAAYVPAETPPFFVRGISLVDNATLLSWESTSGARYQMESRGSFSEGAWTNLGDAIIATGSSTTSTNVRSADSGSQFFRVKRVQ